MKTAHDPHQGQPTGFAEIQEIAGNGKPLLFCKERQVTSWNIKGNFDFRIPAGKIQETEVKFPPALYETNGNGSLHDDHFPKGCPLPHILV